MVEFVKHIFFYQILDGIEKEFIISKTNPKGIITFVNDLFCEISGYSREELIGKPHNIVRHPDMPKKVFQELWDTIKNKKKPWTGLIKNRRKDGSHYWVISTIYPLFDPINPNEISEFVSVRKEVTALMDSYEKDQFFSNFYEILNLFYTNDDLHTILDKSLEIILTFPWLEVESRGGIMLWNKEKKQLEMFVRKGVGESLIRTCSIVPEGRCLCGIAAQKKSLVFKSHVDEEHHNHPEGMQPHGHYNVPLMHGKDLMGVLFLYVENGYKQRKIETEFLELLGQVLGNIIYQFQLQKQLEEQNIKNYLILQYLKQYSSRDTHLIAKERIENIKDINYQYTKNRYLHLMFLDIFNFTGFSEKRTPEEIVKHLNEFFEPIIQIIYQHHGDIDKFMGDAIFSYFEQANDCLEAAVKILKYTETANFKLKIGIHSGFVVHADIGTDFRKDFTLIGDTVNTTQRIQAACQPNQILVSETFYHHVTDYLKEISENGIKISNRIFLRAKNKTLLIPVYQLKLKDIKTEKVETL
ncbi:MAG: PAS domain-containing protein [Leptospiraceae bacterium]|nr:PAS domain-containing protein [Leptospiraceae bacterium]MDW7976065.1 adenylate/guanylate cyclase domain-containing protein [Leptospiraceae bacterium]